MSNDSIGRRLFDALQSNDDNKETSQIRTPSGRKPKTFAEWQEVRRRNPNVYYSASTSRKVIEDRETLGADAFYKRSEEDEI